jgi:hypothetical protein
MRDPGERSNACCIPNGGQQYGSVIQAPVGPHSLKPAAFAEMIEELFPNVLGVELFARAPACNTARSFRRRSGRIASSRLRSRR